MTAETTTTKTTYVLTTRKPSKRGSGYTGVDLPANFRFAKEADVVVSVDPRTGRFVAKHRTGYFAHYYPGAYQWSESVFFQSVEEKAVISPKVVKQLKAAIPEGGLVEPIQVTIEA